MEFGFPFGVDRNGRTRSAGESEHIRHLIEQVLFTSPGERVNRPEFGSGLLRLVFAPNGEVVASAVGMTAQGALQQWLGELIAVEGVDVVHEDSVLRVTVRYLIRSTQAREVTELSVEVG